MGWYPKHSGAAGLPVIVAVSLLLAGNTYAQAPDTGPINSPTRPSILLTPEIMRPLVLKVYGRKPELTQQMINPAILNQQLQQHAELVKLYEATDEKAIYRTPNIATQFASVPAQHMLQAAWLQINHSNNYFVSDSINIGGTPLRFVNSKDFQLLDLRKISSSNRYLQAFDTSARQIPGSVIVELKFLGPDIPSLLLPTVTAPQRPGTGELLLAAATKVTFFTAQNQRFYEAALTPPDSRHDENPQPGRLSSAGEPGDFDVFGVRLTMTLDELKKLASEKGWWTRDLGQFGRRDWSKFVIGNSECQITVFSGLPSASIPTEPGQFCLTVLYRGQQLVGLEGNTTLAGTVEDRRKLVLDKYGPPFAVSRAGRQTFTWGRRNEASVKDEITNNVPDSVFQMSVRERYSTSPPPAGAAPDRWDITSTVYALPLPAPSAGKNPVSGPGRL